MAATGAAAATASASHRRRSIRLCFGGGASRSEDRHLAADFRAPARRTMSLIVMSCPDEQFKTAIAILTMIFVDWHQGVFFLA
jgi:hypothetical protein